MMTDHTDAIVHKGNYIEVLAHDGWEYVRRPTQVGAVAIVAVTDARELVLVEQHRVPIGGPAIELPAGLAGDDADTEGEPMASAARRELLEETGFAARDIQPLAEALSSAGLTNESIHLFSATGLTKEHEGGGVGHENIRVHCVKLNDIPRWLATKENAGCRIDMKIYAGLHFANQL